MRKNALKIKDKLGTYIRQVHIFFHDIPRYCYFFALFQEKTRIVINAETLVPEPMDFPWINPNFRGREYQFIYSLGKELLHPNKVIFLTTRNLENCILI